MCAREHRGGWAGLRCGSGKEAAASGAHCVRETLEKSEVRSRRVLEVIFSAPSMVSGLTPPRLSEFVLQSVCSMHFGTWCTAT